MALAKVIGPGKALGIDLEACHSTAKHELGLVVQGISPLGFAAMFRYVKFVDAVTYKLGDCVTMADADGWDVSNDRAGGSALAGQYPVGFVFQTTVPVQNYYGWVQISGIVTITAGSAAIIAGDPLKPDATEDGDCDEATAGTDENICAVAMATIADNATGLAMAQIRST